jgi:hypothetical protein
MKNYWLNKIHEKRKVKPMDLGLDRNVTCIKRKFRWLVRGMRGDEMLFEHFVRVTSRPNLKIEETSLEKDGKTCWIPGKAEWEAIYFTLYGISDQEAETVSDGLRVADRVELSLLDGCGCLLELWTLKGLETLHCKKITDYAPPEEFSDLEINLKYEEVNYENVTKEGVKYPEIYGFKTPQKHSFMFGYAAGEVEKDEKD